MEARSHVESSISPPRRPCDATEASVISASPTARARPRAPTAGLEFRRGAARDPLIPGTHGHSTSRSPISRSDDKATTSSRYPTTSRHLVTTRSSSTETDTGGSATSEAETAPPSTGNPSRAPSHSSRVHGSESVTPNSYSSTSPTTPAKQSPNRTRRQVARHYCPSVNARSSHSLPPASPTTRSANACSSASAPCVPTSTASATRPATDDAQTSPASPTNSASPRPRPSSRYSSKTWLSSSLALPVSSMICAVRRTTFQPSAVRRNSQLFAETRHTS